jgi:magnesium-transporting ATPase (P-type)
MDNNFERNVIKFLELLYYAEEVGGTNSFIKKNFKKKSNFNHLSKYLEKKDLIFKIPYKNVFMFELSDKGIDFLRERKKEKNQEEFNRIIAFTGAILALIGIYTFIKDIGLINETNDWIKYIFLIFAIVAMYPLIEFIIKSYFKDK